MPGVNKLAGLPRICNLPHPRNPNFSGRELLLTELHTTLASASSHALPQVITGLGGVGKTQLATQYVYLHSDEHTVVWWLRSESETTLAADFASLAAPLGLPEKDQPDQELTVQAVRRWLEQNTGWLLVFDNAGDPSGIRDYFPRSVGSKVIVTSRNRNWKGFAQMRPLQVWDTKEGAQFLTKRTGKHDDEAASALTDALGGLPLALGQAGAYIEATEESLSGYLTLFQEVRLKIFDLENAPATEDYHHTVLTTWNVALQKVQETPLTLELLNLCAFLAPENIPRDLLFQWPSVLGNRLNLNRAIAELGRYSLIEPTENAVSVHRLVQEVTRERLTGAKQASIASDTLRLVASAFPSQSFDQRFWAKSSLLLSHALEIGEYAENLSLNHTQAGALLNNVGTYLTVRAKAADAQTAFERAIRIYEKALGHEHPDVATVLTNFGIFLHNQGKFAEATLVYERALRIRDSTLGGDHQDVARVLVNLGSLLRDQGEFDAAQKSLERALSIQEAVPDSQDTSIELTLNNLGNVYYSQGKLETARETYKRALDIYEVDPLNEHLDMAAPLVNLGSILREQGHLDEALIMFERALKIQEKAFGAVHPNVALVLVNMGNVMRDKGSLDVARSFHERAIRIREVTLNADHPDLARALYNFGNVLHDQGDLDAAEAAYMRAKGIFVTTFGLNHPEMARISASLGNIMLEKSNPRAAKASYEQALELSLRYFGEDAKLSRRLKGHLEEIAQNTQ